MSAGISNAAPRGRPRSLAWAARQRVVMALVLLILFGALRYDHFLGAYNVLSVLRYNSMFALTSLGMCFVIMGAGIDLSVGTAAAFASVVSALLSPYGLLPGLLGGLAAGLAVGVINGLMVTRMNIQPFIATLSGMLAASGAGLLLAHNQSVSVSYDTNFIWLGQGDFLGFPTPAWIAAAAYVYGSIVLNFTSFGRYVLAVGGGEEAARLMGLPVDRVKFLCPVGRVRRARRRDPGSAVRRGPAGGGRRLGAVLDRRGRGRRDPAHRRRRLGGDDARRRPLARPHLQRPQF
jgi:galactofuranose transport system permease protein